MKSSLKLYEAIQAKKEELVKSENPKYLCAPTFRPNQNSDRGVVNIRSAGENQIVSAYKSIILHGQATADLGLNTKHCGFATDEWKHDFKLRLAVLNRNTVLAQLAQLETEVKGVMTTKEKKTVVMGDLTDRLADLG